MKKLPIGIQDFQELREGDYLYVDKTEHIHRLVETGKYYFLSRPRRFGKSLLVSTLRELFLGNQELFKGLWIEDRHDWQPGPVIHIAFNTLGYKDTGLNEAIRLCLEEIAEGYGIELSKPGIALSFRELIHALAKKGKVALLIDEYDKPIIDYLDDLPKAQENREILKNFYSIIKEADRYLRFVFVTGVSKFSKVSIFSDLNNLRDISISRQFNVLTGYTQAELEAYFKESIDQMAKEHGEARETLLERIREWYNGYNWTGPERLYNPFSILNLMEEGQFQNFWFATGTPTFLTKVLRAGWHYQMEKLNVGSVLMDSLQIENPDYRALLFQTGYLTILDQPVYNVYTLGYPNREVKDSLLQHLAGAFIYGSEGDAAPAVLQLKEALENNDLPFFFKCLDSLYSSIPERIFREKTEAAYHSVLYTTLSLLGFHIRCEVATGEGYADAVIETATHIYVMEFKIGHSPQEALELVRRRRYSASFQADPREVLAVGVSFSTEFKGVAEWEAEAF
ncbi:MAG: AAA family ATPase [Lewinellaceae bacterium]|nr:AAA family ATPase [Phaeodactylibacter sp.]MCB9039842.1 AAA family ATPase [Lewinellaceae bacterium]